MLEILTQSSKNAVFIRITKLLVVLLIGISFISCSTEKQLAKQFVDHFQDVKLMVLMPSQVFVVNEKNPDQKGSFLFSEAISDTSILSNTLILKQMNDDSILIPFQQSYKSELKKYGFNLYEEEDMDVFLMFEANAFMVNLAQMEIQEYTTVVEDEISVGENIYSKDIWLNGLNIGVWFEINQLNAEQNKQSPVLFATHDLTDRYEGYFVQKFLTGEIEYRLTVDTISTTNAIDFVKYLGRLYAAYTSDYLMNSYILSNTNENERTQRYFRYDPYRGFFFTTELDKFTELD